MTPDSRSAEISLADRRPQPMYQSKHRAVYVTLCQADQAAPESEIRAAPPIRQQLTAGAACRPSRARTAGLRHRRPGLVRVGRRAGHDDRDAAAIGARQAARVRPHAPQGSRRRRDRRLAAVKRVLPTGMSGTGKSSVTGELAAPGYKAIDAGDGWCEPLPDGRQRRREDAIAALLDTGDADVVFIAGARRTRSVSIPVPA
jgi:hypothetical protein